MVSVLLVRLSAMGDLVQSLGAVASLRRARPEWQLTVVTQTTWVPLLDGFPGIARVVAFDRRGGLAALRDVRRALRQERYDYALDLQGNWKSALIACLSGARQRVGMAGPWRQEPWSRALLHRRIECDAVPHPARSAWELAKHVAADAPFALPRLTATADETRFEREQLAGAGVDPQRPFRIVVGADPTDARALRKHWVGRLTDRDQAVLLTGPDESDFAVGGRGAVLRHERGQMRRLIALGGIVGKVGGEVIGPDKGATHVLLAAGAKGRVLFGSRDPRRSSPPTAVALVTPKRTDCRSCRNLRRRPSGAPCSCMDFDPDDGLRVGLGLPRPDDVHEA